MKICKRCKSPTEDKDDSGLCFCCFILERDNDPPPVDDPNAAIDVMEAQDE